MIVAIFNSLCFKRICKFWMGSLRRMRNSFQKYRQLVIGMGVVCNYFKLLVSLITIYTINCAGICMGEDNSIYQLCSVSQY